MVATSSEMTRRQRRRCEHRPSRWLYRLDGLYVGVHMLDVVCIGVRDEHPTSPTLVQAMSQTFPNDSQHDHTNYRTTIHDKTTKSKCIGYHVDLNTWTAVCEVVNRMLSMSMVSITSNGVFR